VVGVVDHWTARVGFQLPVDDLGASDRDGHAWRKGEVVVDLDHDTLAEVDAEALVGPSGPLPSGSRTTTRP
jgi:hypothetical protein